MTIPMLIEINREFRQIGDIEWVNGSRAEGWKVQMKGTSMPIEVLPEHAESFERALFEISMPHVQPPRYHHVPTKHRT